MKIDDYELIKNWEPLKRANSFTKKMLIHFVVYICVGGGVRENGKESDGK